MNPRKNRSSDTKPTPAVSIAAGQGGETATSVLHNVLSACADLVITVDPGGVIRGISPGDSLESHPGWGSLKGKTWVSTVTKESQRKADLLLSEARTGRRSKSREVNQLVEGIGEVPFRFSGVLDDDGSVIVLGRDLRPIALMQQRLVSSQQAMDIEYGRLRQADTRYRVFFQVAVEGVLVADNATGRVLEANPAASSMLGESAQALQGELLQDLFEPPSVRIVQSLIAAVEGGARPGHATVHLKGQLDRPMSVSVSFFRQSGGALVLLRFWSASTAGATPWAARASRMLSVLEAMPDGFVVTGEDRRIVSVNSAFCDLVQQANENQVLGEPLDRWLGRPGVDLNIMAANLREHQVVRNFATVIRSDFGPAREAVVAAVTSLDGKVPYLGFMIRAVSSTLPTSRALSVVPRSFDQLRQLVGRVPLKDLVRESSDMIERLCIEAALDVSGNNRASAAQLLGLSRQGLYLKLKRHGIEEGASDSGAPV